MTGVWALAALWLGLALVASLLSIWLRVSTALSEIVVGTIAQLIIGAAIGSAVLGTDESWVKFLSGIGAIVLTFLAGAELDPAVFKLKWKEAAAIGRDAGIRATVSTSARWPSKATSCRGSSPPSSIVISSTRCKPSSMTRGPITRPHARNLTPC